MTRDKNAKPHPKLPEKAALAPQSKRRMLVAQRAVRFLWDAPLLRAVEST
jgi:hypothetical protein